MLEQLDDYDWEKVFEAAGQCGSDNPGTPSAVEGDSCATDLFTRDDVAEIIAMEDGENDELSWTGVFLLKDGRFAHCDGGCDYTGWD